MNRLAFYAIATAALGGSLLAIACKATIEAEAGPGTPMFGGSKLKVDIDAGSRTVSVPPNFPQPAPGSCVKVNFVGPNGELLSTEEVTVGGPGAVAPEGTEGITVSPCDPPEEEEAERVTPDGRTLRTYPFRWLPYDTSGPVWFIDFTVEATDVYDAQAKALDFLRHTLTEKKPEGVEVYGFAGVHSRDGRVRFAVVSDEKPTKLLVQWNDGRVASLRDGVTRRLPAGWYASTYFVPTSMVDYGPGFDVKNVAAYHLETPSKTIDMRLSVAVQQ